MTTDRQMKAVAEAIQATIDRKDNWGSTTYAELAQAAIAASNAHHVPGLVFGLLAITTMPLAEQDNMNATNLRLIARNVLAQLPPELLEDVNGVKRVKSESWDATKS